MIDNKQQLMNCPFCDEIPELLCFSEPANLHRYGEFIHWIECSNPNCITQSDKLWTLEEVIKLWNIRAKPLPDVEEAEIRYSRPVKDIILERFSEFVKNGDIDMLHINAEDVSLKLAFAVVAKQQFLPRPPTPLPDNKEVGKLVELIDKIIWGIDHCSTKHSIIAKCEQLKVSLTVMSQLPAISDDVVERVARALALCNAIEHFRGKYVMQYVHEAWHLFKDRAIAAIAAMEGK